MSKVMLCIKMRDEQKDELRNDPEAICPYNFFEVCVCKCVCVGGGGGGGGGRGEGKKYYGIFYGNFVILS